MRPALHLAVLLASLAGCAGPPPSAYLGGSSARSADGVGLGKNGAGEACTQQAQGDGADIFCGTWDQPSGHVVKAGAGGPAGLQQAATASRWRNALDNRFDCGAPSPTTILARRPGADHVLHPQGRRLAAGGAGRGGGRPDLRGGRHPAGRPGAGPVHRRPLRPGQPAGRPCPGARAGGGAGGIAPGGAVVQRRRHRSIPAADARWHPGQPRRKLRRPPNGPIAPPMPCSASRWGRTIRTPRCR